MSPRQEQSAPPQPTTQQLIDSIAALTAAFTAFQNSQDQRHNEYLSSIDNLHQCINISTFTTLHNQQSSGSSSNTDNDNTLKPPKIRLLPFDGNNLMDWVFQAEQFFSPYSIPRPQRLANITGYMIGDALEWYQWMHNNNLLSTWDAFTSALEVRFGPSAYDNHNKLFSNLSRQPQLQNTNEILRDSVTT